MDEYEDDKEEEKMNDDFENRTVIPVLKSTHQSCLKR